MYLHLIEDYARLNGHADLLRERIDGRTRDGAPPVSGGTSGRAQHRGGVADRSGPAVAVEEKLRTLAGRAAPGLSVPEHVDADTAFHRAVIVAAHNDILIQLFDTFLPRLRIAMIDMLHIHPLPSPPTDHAAHERLAAAIAARDPDAATALSRDHLRAIKEAFS